MTPPAGAVLLGGSILGALVLAGEATASTRAERWTRLTSAPHRVGRSAPSRIGLRPSAARSGRFRWLVMGGAPRPVWAVGLGAAGWMVGSALAPPLGGPAGAIGLAMLPRALERRRQAKAAIALERQVADLAEAAAQALRSGLSMTQSLEFALGEVESPLREILEGALARQALGIPMEEALGRLAEEVGTDDARLLVLVVGIHARSGGDLAEALDEVSRTIRHRIGVRRELRALSAQGRVSGAILGSLPIAFFLVLSVTSRKDLDPVLRSPVGMAMVGAGLLMQGLAYLWIRRLLRVAM